MKTETKEIKNPSKAHAWRHEINASSALEHVEFEVMLKSGEIVKASRRFYINEDSFLRCDLFTKDLNGDELSIAGQAKKWRPLH